MQIVAVTRCHYGLDYIAAVVESTAPLADKHIILYSARPTFHHATALPNPDSEADLRAIAEEAGKGRVEWHNDMPVSVAQAMALYPEADMILELDADEIIEPLLCRGVVERYARGELTAYCYRLPMLHFWRSFSYVCKDGNHPQRLYLPAHRDKGDTAFFPETRGNILHMGYARTIVDMQYKLSLSEHQDEFRPRWWDDRFMCFPDVLTDLHPITPDMWNAEFYDRELLPGCLRRHKYYDLKVIE